MLEAPPSGQLWALAVAMQTVSVFLSFTSPSCFLESLDWSCERTPPLKEFLLMTCTISGPVGIGTHI